MVIDINLLKRQGKTCEQLEFDFPIESEVNLCPDIRLESGKFIGEIVLKDKVYISGDIKVIARGECSRCLADAEEEILIEVDEVFSERPVDDEYRYKSGRVDLSEMIRDKLLSNQPTVILCSKDCKGLCPKCGCNLNGQDCNCEK